jgi:hypothetical protein
MRKIVVLEEAAEDIERGREFYDLQEVGVGDYFEDTILSDIESLGLFHGIHADILDSIAFFLNNSPLESTTEKHQKPRRFLLSLIFEEIQFGYARN